MFTESSLEAKLYECSKQGMYLDFVGMLILSTPTPVAHQDSMSVCHSQFVSLLQCRCKAEIHLKQGGKNPEGTRTDTCETLPIQ